MRHPRRQGHPDRIEVLGALGQHQHFAAEFEGGRNLGRNRFGPGKVLGKVPEHVLNARRGRQLDAGRP
jgi:hypothetical protein